MTRSRSTKLALSAMLAAASVACSSREPPEEPPSTMPTEAPNEADQARCTTEAEVRAHLGQVCTVVGTYQLEEFRNQKGAVFRSWPVIILADGKTSVALESLWDESKQPSAAEIERWRGRTVEVTGKLHNSPPAEDRVTNMSQLTISPVDAIRLAP